MKSLIQSTIVLALILSAFAGMSYKLEQFNSNMAKAMFQVPAPAASVLVAEVK